MTELRDVLQQRAAHLANSLRDADEFSEPVVAKAVRRKRASRTALISTAATIAVIGIGTGAWAGYGALNPAPVASATPSPTASASAGPKVTQSPRATPSPEHTIVSGADVEILERLQHPTTGETWHAPQEIDAITLYASDDGLDPGRFYAVGSREGATIVAVVPSGYNFYGEGYGIDALLEVDGSQVRWLTCPSARETDPCLTAPSDPAPGVVVDKTTHYDSLTYPIVTSPVAGWNLGTAPNIDIPYPEVGYFGAAVGFPGITYEDYESDFTEGAKREVLAALGDSTLVELRTAGVVPGTTSVRYAIETPLGSVIWLGHGSGNTWSPSTVNGAWYEEGSVVWDDGKDTFVALPADEPDDVPRPVPATEYCGAPDDVLLDSFDASEWAASGIHGQGATVYLPTEGGNPPAKATWSWMKGNSWADQVEASLAYPYPKYRDFLAARSVFAWERPDGEWVLAINANAGQWVYECA